MVLNDSIAPIFCLWCSKEIPRSRRGHGHPPKTCSEKCRKLRAAAREKERYQKVKHTAHWQSVREDYVRRIKQRLASDPEYAAIFRAYSNERVREWRAKVNADPEKRAAILSAQRVERAQWRQRLLNTEMAWEAYKFKARRWYHALSDDEKAEIYGTRSR